MADKWGRRLFKFGGAWLVLLGIVHSTSLFHPMTAANETERQLLDLMADYKFNLMGSMRSMSDLVRGFSISFTLGAFGLGAIDLALSRERGGLLKRVALVNVIWLAALTAVAFRYFFAAPLSFLVVALLIFVVAWLKLPSEDVR